MNIRKAIKDMEYNVNDDWHEFNIDVLLVIGLFYLIMIVIDASVGIINAGDIVFSVIGFGTGFIVSALILFHKYVIYVAKKIAIGWKNE